MNHPDFRRAARVAYEQHRARSAALFALPLLLFPVLGCCLGAAERTACVVAIALLAVGVVALWRGQVAARALWPGVLAGLLPLGLALAARSYGHACLGGSCTSLCVPACALGGLLAGVAVAYAARRSKAPARYALVAGSAALLVGCLGCSCVGYAGMLGLALGLGVPLAVVSAYCMQKMPA